MATSPRSDKPKTRHGDGASEGVRSLFADSKQGRVNLSAHAMSRSGMPIGIAMAANVTPIHAEAWRMATNKGSNDSGERPLSQKLSLEPLVHPSAMRMLIRRHVKGEQVARTRKTKGNRRLATGLTHPCQTAPEGVAYAPSIGKNQSSAKTATGSKSQQTARTACRILSAECPEGQSGDSVIIGDTILAKLAVAFCFLAFTSFCCAERGNLIVY